MATIKSFTDLQQSKKLVEILPLESADYTRLGKDEDNVLIRSYFESCSSELKEWIGKDEMYPCWSLTSLLSVLPDTITSNDGIAFKLNIKKSIIEYSNPSLYLVYKSVKANNLIDACVAMIERLHELKML